MFLFSDSQIKLESFVEDINALLNSGEVPNLFPYDERASVCEAVRPAAVKAGRPAESPTDLWNFFVERTKANLHIVLCFSPIGDAFRCVTAVTDPPWSRTSDVPRLRPEIAAAHRFSVIELTHVRADVHACASLTTLCSSHSDARKRRFGAVVAGAAVTSTVLLYRSAWYKGHQ